MRYGNDPATHQRARCKVCKWRSPFMNPRAATRVADRHCDLSGHTVVVETRDAVRQRSS